MQTPLRNRQNTSSQKLQHRYGLSATPTPEVGDLVCVRQVRQTCQHTRPLRSYHKVSQGCMQAHTYANVCRKNSNYHLLLRFHTLHYYYYYYLFISMVIRKHANTRERGRRTSLTTQHVWKYRLTKPSVIFFCSEKLTYSTARLTQCCRKFRNL